MQELNEPQKFLFYIIQDMVHRDIWQLLISRPDMSITDYLETEEVPWFTRTGLLVLKEMKITECNFIEAMRSMQIDLSNPVNVHIGFAVEGLSRTYSITFTP